MKVVLRKIALFCEVNMLKNLIKNYTLQYKSQGQNGNDKKTEHLKELQADFNLIMENNLLRKEKNEQRD